MHPDSSQSSEIHAWEYLEKQGYVPPDAQGGKVMLSYKLLLLVHCALPNILPKAIRADGTLLECEEVGQNVDTITTAIMCKLDPVVNLMDHMADMV